MNYWSLLCLTNHLCNDNIRQLKLHFLVSTISKISGRKQNSGASGAHLALEILYSGRQMYNPVLDPKQIVLASAIAGIKGSRRVHVYQGEW